MNKSETAKILGYIKGAYIYIFSKFTENEREAMVMTWQNSFKNTDFKEVSEAVIKWCNAEKLAPTIADIKKTMFELSNINITTSSEAWEIVLKKCSIDRRYAKENFGKLPNNIKKAIGSYSFLCELGNANDQQSSYLRKEFESKYNSIIEIEQKKLFNGEITYAQLENNNALLENN